MDEVEEVLHAHGHTSGVQAKDAVELIGPTMWMCVRTSKVVHVVQVELPTPEMGDSLRLRHGRFTSDQLLFRHLTCSDVHVHHNGAPIALTGQGGNLHAEPARLGRRIAGILRAELSQLVT